MPTPPQSYSPAAADKLRRALLVLAATAMTTGCDLSSSNSCSTQILGVPQPPPPSNFDGDGLKDGEKPAVQPAEDPATEPIVPGEPPAIPVDEPAAPEAAEP